jgi:hypothetical protein
MGTKPAESSTPSPRAGPAFAPTRWLVILACLVLLAVIIAPNFKRAGGPHDQIAQGNACARNLLQIQGAKESWAIENKVTAGATVEWSNIVSYLRNSEAPIPMIVMTACPSRLVGCVQQPNRVDTPTLLCQPTAIRVFRGPQC